MNIEVGCLCGEVRISLDGEPLSQLYCHCDDCQAVHGAAYVGVALFPSEAVKIIKGQPVKWTYKSNPRSRCKNCGTILYAEPPGKPFLGVKANLIPSGMFKPACHVQCQHAVLPVVDDLPHYKGFHPNETVSW